MKEINYQVIYSLRRTISISVKGQSVIVKAPYLTKKNKIEQVINSHLVWIEKNLERQKEIEKRFSVLDENKIKELKILARQKLKPLLDFYSEKMGVSYNKFSITSAKTRFGSCSIKGNISFSYRLMLYPESAIEYVVVHELAHRKYMNHQKEFYAFIERFLPDYKERKKLLKN